MIIPILINLNQNINFHYLITKLLPLHVYVLIGYQMIAVIYIKLHFEIKIKI